MNEKAKIVTRIRQLRLKLANTDYKAIKYAEGELTSSEYEIVRQKRAEWRHEINALETKLNILRGK